MNPSNVFMCFLFFNRRIYECTFASFLFKYYIINLEEGGGGYKFLILERSPGFIDQKGLIKDYFPNYIVNLALVL